MLEPTSSVMVKVFTTDGRQRTHTYPLEGSISELIEFVNELSSNVMDAIRGKNSALYMKNPVIYYKSEYIVSIEWNIIGSDELQKAVEKAHRRPGFKT